MSTIFHQKTGIAFGILVVVIVAAAVYAGERGSFSNSDDTNASNASSDITTTVPVTPATGQTTPATAPSSAPGSTASYSYKNGTYSATGTYDSPGGQDEIAVSLTIANDVVTDATVTSVIADRESLHYQNRFISGYKQYVVGQKLSSIHLTRVSGSSLTPAGFDAALERIKSQAQA